MLAYLIMETFSLAAYAGKYILGKVAVALYNTAFPPKPLPREISLIDIQHHLDRIEARITQNELLNAEILDDNDKKLFVSNINDDD